MNTPSNYTPLETPFTDRRFGIRLLLLTAVGTFIALFLTWFMHALIQSSEMVLDESQRTHMLDFVRLKHEEFSKRQERKPERPEVEEAPPAPVTPQSEAAASDMAALAISAMPTDADMGLGIGGFAMGAGEGEYLPIVKVVPVYPLSASSRGIEGDCAVEYTVTTAGTTRDIRVLEGRCSDTVFEKPSIAAARKFKYKPRVVNGEPVEVTGVRNVFTYVLENDDSAEDK